MRRLIQEGPRDAKIVLVGEAPGATEDATGSPFQGGAGELLNRMLERSGIARSGCFITNVAHERPPGNDFNWFYKKGNQAALFAGIIQLKKDIEEIKPNVVVALGAQPLKILTGKPSIDKWRGSILESTLIKGQKIIGTYHPAYCLRVYDYKAVSEFDLNRVREESSFPDIRLPARSHYLNPDGGIRDSLVSEMEQSEWLAVDIECWLTDSGKWALACVGFSDRADRSLVIAADSAGAMLAIRRLCACSAKKVLQNGTFDVTVLRDQGIEVNNFVWDTMLAHHALFAECASGADEMSVLRGKKRQSAIAKGLAFQASIYTKEPYYKDDGKLWKNEGDIRQFWLYNGKDAAVTREIRDVQARELAEFGTQCVLTHEMSLVEPCMEATRLGIRIDLPLRQQLRAQTEAEINNLQKFLDAAAGGSINVKSSQQVTSLLYDKLKLPAKTKRRKDGSETVTGDKDAINELAGKYSHPVLHAILKIRERRDLIERYLDAAVGRDGRMRCSFDITGTRSGRLSSRASLDGSGTNLQNIPSRRKEGEQIRRIFIADPGKVLVARDYKQAEAWIVAYKSNAEGLIELLNNPTRDMHRENAARIFGKPIAEITDTERYLAKKVVHASNYGMGPARLVELVAEESELTGIRIKFSEAQDLINKYFMLYPEIKDVFWRGVETDLRYSRTLNTPFGRKRTFYSRWDDKLLREAYSYIPQSTVGDLGGKAFAACYYQIQRGRPDLQAELLLNVHDSVMMQAPPDKVAAVAEAMRQAMEISISVGSRTFAIPSDCKVGLNWAKYDKKVDPQDVMFNPNGLRDLDERGFQWLESISQAA